jgi:hypothetical protein
MSVLIGFVLNCEINQKQSASVISRKRLFYNLSFILKVDCRITLNTITLFLRIKRINQNEHKIDY